MTAHGIYVAQNIWVKSVPDFKLNTTRNKPIPVEDDMVQVPKDLVKLHKYIYLMADIFFVNSIPFFLTLISNIWFIAVNELSNIKVETILKAFKDVYNHYKNRGFHVTTIHADG